MSGTHGSGPTSFAGGPGISGSNGGFGGGGSFLSSDFFNLLTATATRTGDGEVSIEYLGAAPIPEPGMLALLGGALVGVRLLRRKPAAAELDFARRRRA
ncbi:MAG: PEP-CTERM sorting domain-containing protein [Acetobacteraceae bacterium]